MKKGWMRSRGAVCLLCMGMLLAGTMRNRQEAASDQKAGENLQEAAMWESRTKEEETLVLENRGEEQEAAVSEDHSETDGVGNLDETGTSLPPRVALTFDDGPHPVYTAQLLDGLKERGIPATFFVIGENIPGNEGLIQRMDQEGHLIGNHTYSHANLKDLSDEAACLELTRTNQLLEEITGQPAAYVRPPFGNWKDSLDSLVSMIAVKWTVDSLDWNSRNASEIVSSVLTDVSDGDIILMHDYYATSVEAALEIADRLQAEGYKFVTVEELILE